MWTVRIVPTAAFLLAAPRLTADLKPLYVSEMTPVATFWTLYIAWYLLEMVTTRADQPVIQSGPYRWVRHPSYAGALLSVLGIVLCSTNWLSLACLLIVASGYAYRIRVEEQALAADLGPPYRDYMRRTKRLIPRVL